MMMVMVMVMDRNLSESRVLDKNMNTILFLVCVILFSYLITKPTLMI